MCCASPFLLVLHHPLFMPYPWSEPSVFLTCTCSPIQYFRAHKNCQMLELLIFKGCGQHDFNVRPVLWPKGTHLCVSHSALTLRKAK